jgi:hypothetical protein
LFFVSEEKRTATISSPGERGLMHLSAALDHRECGRTTL